jgi:hypothetical protein
MRDGKGTRRKVQECSSSVCAVLGKNETEESKIFSALAQSYMCNPILVDVFADLALRIKQLTDAASKEQNSQGDQSPSMCEEQHRNVLSAENDILRRNIQQMHKQNSKLGKHNTYLQIKKDVFQQHNESLVQDNEHIFSNMKGLHNINQQMGSDLATIQQEMKNIVQKYAMKASKETGAADNETAEHDDLDSMDVVYST